MTSIAATCRDCDRPRKPGATFCECGALLDYSAPAGEQWTDGEPGGEVVAATTAGDFEWPPGPYEPTSEAVPAPTKPMRVVHCRNEQCKVLNPETLVFCWKCGTPMAHGEEAKPPWSLRRALHLEKSPLRANERDRPAKPFISREPMALLRAGLIVAGALLLAGVLLIAVSQTWRPAWERTADAYGASREALFPRFHPVHPSSVNPPRRKLVSVSPPRWKLKAHPPADAFDRNLSTYWQSTTDRDVSDRITVTFKPAAEQIDEVVVFAGDPTAGTIVPDELQMTFYRWESRKTLPNDACEEPPVGKRGAFCVIAIAKPFKLANTPTPQRFATGDQRNVAKVVVTIRGIHRTDDPELKAALTDVEFFDKH